MTKTPEGTTETPYDTAKRALESALRVIGTQIEDAEASKVGSRKRNAVPRLAAQVVNLFGELRKAEKAVIAGVRDYTRETVLTWARTQSKEARARLVKDLQAIDNPNRRSVLG